MLSDKHTVATDPHINPPYIPLYWQNHWAQNYTVPVNKATSVQVTDKFDSGFRIAVGYISYRLICLAPVHGVQDGSNWTASAMHLHLTQALEFKGSLSWNTFPWRYSGFVLKSSLRTKAVAL